MPSLALRFSATTVHVHVHVHRSQFFTYTKTCCKAP